MEIELWHPVVNHFTIALIIFGIFLDFIGKIFRNDTLHFAGWLNLIFGSVAGVLTVITGLIAEDNINVSPPVHDILEKHETIGFVILGLVIIMVVWRIFISGKFPARGSSFYAILAVSVVILIAINGFYGGEMVFKYGAAVKVLVATEGNFPVTGNQNSSTTTSDDTGRSNLKPDSIHQIIDPDTNKVPANENNNPLPEEGKTAELP
jgi:uncharacterized membrane protein